MATTAETLLTRVHLTGKSVYWCNIFKDSDDPTFVFLSYFWYAVYAWDEAFDQLYKHICHLVSFQSHVGGVAVNIFAGISSALHRAMGHNDPRSACNKSPSSLLHFTSC
jgi:hypothetical protein